MEKLPLSIIIIIIITASGLCTFSSHVKHQYHFVYEPKNITAARSYCREKYMDLASIDGLEDVEILRNMADFSNMAPPHNHLQEAWIGLYAAADSWRWSLSDTSFYKDSESSFRRWATGEPDNGNGEDHCTLTFIDGVWVDENCQHNFRAFCMNVTGSNVTFVFIDSLMTWPEAQSYCRAHHTDLASVRNLEDIQRLKQLQPHHYAWIGLYKDAWRWFDGRAGRFSYWADLQPSNSTGNELCALANFTNSGKWEDRDCDMERGFICLGPPPITKRVIKVKLVGESSVDLNQPVVTENMLTQIRQRLDGNVKLSWRTQPDGNVFHKEEETKMAADEC